MNTITRHILFDLIKLFVLICGALTSLMLTIGVLHEAMQQGLPFAQVVFLIPYVLPNALQLSLPATLLLATTSVYGRLSGFNEVVAMKALGISPLAILKPAYVLGFLMSLATFCVNDLAVSWGRLGVERVVTEALEEIIYSVLSTQQCYTSQQMSINVKRVEGRRLIRVTLSLQGAGRGPSTVIEADEAEICSDLANRKLKLQLYNVRGDIQGQIRAHLPSYELEIPLRDPVKEKELGLPSSMPIRLIPDRTAEKQAEILQFQQDQASRAALTMLGGDFERLAGSEWKAYPWELKDRNNQLNRLLLEPQRRWAWGFSCFFFVWVGAPMAVRLRHGDYLTIFFLCFLPILIVYYPLMIWAVSAAKNGTVPVWLVWSSNGMLFLFGAWLLRKVMRY